MVTSLILIFQPADVTITCWQNVIWTIDFLAKWHSVVYLTALVGGLKGVLASLLFSNKINSLPYLQGGGGRGGLSDVTSTLIQYLHEF